MFELQMEARMDLEGCRPQVETRASQIWDQLGSVFEKWESGEGTLDSVQVLLAQLRYVDNALAMTEPDPAG